MSRYLHEAITALNLQDPDLTKLRNQAAESGQNIIGLTEGQLHFLDEMDGLIDTRPITTQFDREQQVALNHHRPPQEFFQES